MSSTQIVCEWCGGRCARTGRRQKYCSKCRPKARRVGARDWYNKNKSSPDFLKSRSEQAKKFRRAHPAYRLWLGAKWRAKERGLLFDISENDIEIPEVCPVFGQPFKPGTPYAASLDRIDPALGYIRGNIQVISRRANEMKRDATEKELKDFSKWALKTFGH